jgi:hypothetical protein
MFDDRAQMHTLEGVAAATIMLLVIVYAIDATSMTPLTSSTANVHVETELQVIGQDILGTTDYAEPGYNSKLKNDILTWNGTEYIWSGTKYIEKGGTANLTNNLTNILNATLIGQGIAHNVELTFLFENGTSYSTEKMIYDGNPSENAVIVSRKIVLYDGDINKSKYSNNPINDIDPSTSLYNIVDVKLILWRM